MNRQELTKILENVNGISTLGHFSKEYEENFLKHLKKLINDPNLTVNPTKEYFDDFDPSKPFISTKENEDYVVLLNNGVSTVALMNHHVDFNSGSYSFNSGLDLNKACFLIPKNSDDIQIVFSYPFTADWLGDNLTIPSLEKYFSLNPFKTELEAYKTTLNIENSLIIANFYRELENNEPDRELDNLSDRLEIMKYYAKHNTCFVETHNTLLTILQKNGEIYVLDNYSGLMDEDSLNPFDQELKSKISNFEVIGSVSCDVWRVMLFDSKNDNIASISDEKIEIATTGTYNVELFDTDILYKEDKKEEDFKFSSHVVAHLTKTAF